VQGPILSGHFHGPVTLISGSDLFRRFAEAPALSQHIRVLDFQTLVNERTREFVGREYVFSAINSLLTKGADFPSGYIVIRGEPGIGKTSLLAQLVKEKGYVHHFNIAAQNIGSASDFLGNVCAQLVVRYGLDYPILSEETTKNSGFLSRLLAEIAAKSENRPLVVLVDAMDEAEGTGTDPSDSNRLFLPPILPPGVFFVLTTRPQADYRLSVDRREDIHFDDTDPRNLDDVRKYIQGFIQLHKEQMIVMIAKWGISEDRFVSEITAKSEGNFMYLVWVLRDICEGKLTTNDVNDIRKLPQGLAAYYQRHWRTMKGRNSRQFLRYHQPVVCILATAREPVEVHQIAEWTHLAPMQILEVIGEWRQFLNVKDGPQQGGYKYCIYHASFRDFLAAEVGLTQYDTIISRTALGKIRW
jgi:hypothetical protein